MLWLGMGLGKTIISLTAISFLIKIGRIRRVLIVAPKQVCQTVWRQEAAKWEHTHSLSFSLITGSAKQRSRALFRDAQIYLINYENLSWLKDQLDHFYVKKKLPYLFDMIVWDEVTHMKHSTTNRGKAARHIWSKVPLRVGLTGTPASNGYIDLHGQYLVVDGGKSLSPHVTHYRNLYFYQRPNGFEWLARPGAKKDIHAAIQPITLEMSTNDYLSLPEFTVVDLNIEFSKKLQKQYDILEREMITEIDDTTIAVFNAAAVSMKCRQFANGSLYKNPGSLDAVHAHKLKLDVLENIVAESGDNNLLIAYSFKIDVTHIQSRFPDAINLSGIEGRELEQTVINWNAGKIKMLIGHPASAGKGLNLQKGGNLIVWYGLPWALDHYEQFNARILRQGQTKPVFCYRIVAPSTIESVISDALALKYTSQEGLKKAIKKFASTRL